MTEALKIIPLERTCSTCTESKPVSEFYRASHNLKKNGGYNYICISCEKSRLKIRRSQKSYKEKAKENVRKWRESLKDSPEKLANYLASEAKAREKSLKSDSHFRRKYGITYADVLRAYDSQFGLCANHGCSREVSLNVRPGNGRAVVDHNHQTGKFRALLCMHCNTLLGTVENSLGKILGLMDYLNKHNQMKGNLS